MHLGAWPGGSWLPWRAALLGCVFVLVSCCTASAAYEVALLYSNAERTAVMHGDVQ